MHSPSPTAAERRRWDWMQEVGCVACLIDDPDRLGTPGDVHHLLAGGRRLGHRLSVILCPYHHRGYGSANTGSPSLARDPRAFTACYGSPAQLLEFADEAAARLISAYSRTIEDLRHNLRAADLTESARRRAIERAAGLAHYVESDGIMENDPES